MLQTNVSNIVFIKEKKINFSKNKLA